MEHNVKEQTIRQFAVEATEREQAFCLEAMESSEYDTLTDEEWVELCENIAKVHLRQARECQS